MNHLAYIKNDITGEVFDTNAKVLKLQSTENLNFYLSPELENVNWSDELVLPLNVMYRMRAAQLRKTYDYIIFYFSGGSDSVTALNAFIRNNIHIDEIVIYINSDSKDLKVSNLYALQYIKNVRYNGFINIIDLNYSILSDILKKKSWKRFECFSGLLHSFYRFRIDFFEELGYSAPVNREGNIAHLYSGLFPTIHRVENDFYGKVSINSVRIAPGGPDNVQFFTANDFPQLHVKQSHLLAKRYASLGSTSIFHNEDDANLKLAIRDEYKSKINTPKGKGITDIRKMTIGSQHDMLIKLYANENEFIKNYNLVLEYFNGLNTINLDNFNKTFFLFRL